MHHHLIWYRWAMRLRHRWCLITLCLRKRFPPYWCFKRLLTFDHVPIIPIFDLDHSIADLCSSSVRQAQCSTLFRDRSINSPLHSLVVSCVHESNGKIALRIVNSAILYASMVMKTLFMHVLVLLLQAVVCMNVSFWRYCNEDWRIFFSWCGPKMACNICFCDYRLMCFRCSDDLATTAKTGLLPCQFHKVGESKS